MRITNVKAQWLFIDAPDDNNNYRVTIVATPELSKQIDEELDKLAQTKGLQLSQCDWKGSKKIAEDTGEITYTAKCGTTIKKKDGSIVERKLAVFDERAQRLNPVPKVTNGAIINLVIEPYFAEYKKKKGVMLGLRNLQLVKWEEYEGDNPYEDLVGDEPSLESDEESIF